MKNNKHRQLKSALVILFAMLIFFTSIPNYSVIKAHAGDDDIRIIFEDDEEITDDDDDDDDDEDDEDDDEDSEYVDPDDDDDDEEGQENKSGSAKSESTKLETNKNKKTSSKKTHRKVTVDISGKNSFYYDKLVPGDDLKISVKVKGKKIKNKNVKFSSSKKTVATVSKGGVITAKKEGTAKIRISSRSNKSFKCTMIITVAGSLVKTLFIGDSRSVDIFSAGATGILGEVHNNVVVCALNGGNVNFMNEVVNNSDLNDYDTIITWMGCNDYGVFKPYKKNYSKLVSQGKKLVLCTVGASSDQNIRPELRSLFGNGVISGFNSQLKKWAKKKKVKTIPLYEYVQKNMAFDAKDGVHYSSKTNKALWHYILENFRES